MIYDTLEQALNESPSLLLARDGVVIDTESFPRTYTSNRTLIRVENFFNGSICRYNDRILFACRGDQKPWFSNMRIVLSDLGEDFQPIQSTETDWMSLDSKLGPNHVEDPRLFECGNEIKLTYTDGYDMYLAHLDKFMKVRRQEHISTFKELSSGDGREKNWTPFDYLGEPHFIYSDNPRIIVNRKGIFLSKTAFEWKWGKVSGGTPAIKWGEYYITFFHSSITFKNPHHKRIYYMGAYLFEAKPPFDIVAVTQYPILKGSMSVDGENPVNQDVCVVFPSGVIQEKDHFSISYGFNDFNTRVIKVTKTALTSILK